MKRSVEFSLFLIVGLVVGYFIQEIHVFSVKQAKIEQEYNTRKEFPNKIVPIAPDIKEEFVFKEESVFKGPWKTSSGAGEMTCNIVKNSDKNFHGKFFGVWSGSEFEYSVEWTMDLGKCIGQANIDGTDYEWTGEFVLKEDKCWYFDGEFTGATGRKGSFSLKEEK